MSFKILIVSSVVAVLAGGLVLYSLFQQDSSQPKDANEAASDAISEPVNQVEVANQSGQGTLKSLLDQAINLECTITYKADSVDNQVVEGTYFTSEGKLRGDFLMPSEAGEVVTSMILRDDIFYSWSEIMGQKYGMKFDIKTVASAEAAGNLPDTREPVPLDATVDYSCKAWPGVDGSIFEPPTDIIFTDYNTAVSGGMDYGSVYSESNINLEGNSCDICAQVSAGPSRDECLANFNCP